MIRVADYVIQFLENYGVENIFTVSGGGSIFLCDAVASAKKLKYFCCHHEQAVSYASEAYARTKNSLGVSLVTTGPGATNAISGACGSWMDSVPHLLISGQVFLNQTIGTTGLRQLGVQEINIIDIIKPVTKYAIMVTDPETIKYHLQKAIHLATTGRPGPVWIDIPANIQNAQINEEELIEFNSAEIPVETNLEFTEKIAQVANLLKEAKRPLLLAGHGVRLAGATNEFLKLAERHQIPLTTSWNADDIVNFDHDLFIGRPGAFASRGVNFAIQNADLLISIGSRLPFMITGYNSKDFARNARVVMVDIDQTELDKSCLNIFSKVRSDANEFLVSLNQQLSKDQFQVPQEWIKHCQNWKQKYPVILPEYKDHQGSINSYYFMDLLSDLLQANDVIVTDMGLSFVGTHQAFRTKTGQKLMTNSGFAPMGWGLPAAVGACIAHGKQQTICLSGEGGLMMNIQELATIMHHKLPIKLFIYNNGGYLTIKQTQQLGFNGRLMGSDEDSGISFPDFVKVAEAHGIPAIRLDSHENLKENIQKFLEQEGMGVCDLILDNEQEQCPKAINRRKPDGTTEPTVFEDMYPFLSKEEIESNMLPPISWD